MSAGRPYSATATGFLVTTPATVVGVVLTGGADASAISIYDTADLSKIPVASANLMAKVKAAINTTVEVHTPFVAQHGVYLVVDSGTTPTTIAYIK